MNQYTIPAYILPSEHFFCELRAVELRFNPHHDEKGRFCSGNRLDKSHKSGIIKAGSENVALEYQRYGRNKNTIVNKTYIESGEYRRKFDKLTDNSEINRKIYIKAKEALIHRSGTELEDMFWFDSTSGMLIAQETNSTAKRSITYSDKTRSVVERNNNPIALHTHPSSMPPSAADFNSCFRNNYKIGFIACHNGRLFAYTSNQEISEMLYELYISESIASGLSEYDAQLNSLNKIKENHDIDFWEVL